ncbi:hypothetical protein [Streptomyces griseoaurantiacus]|uniref:hypothetical protein n=1 Tax=Streptomyces griseoaurantiacus TaxID=68213 RepID=UPI0017849AFE|nr:hypothetical protein [Streptomyces jietaisiensis]GHE77490.1 hypothetical protein GCM10018782_58870 [Streptomyces griseoaurantiacus]
MGSKTVDEAGATVTGAEAKTADGTAADGTAEDGAATPPAPSEETAAAEQGTGDAATDLTEAEAGQPAESADATDSTDVAADPEAAGTAGVGQGAGAVVSAALGVVSLTGGWVGTVASARETLVGQLRTSSSASVATQIKEVYGDAWHAAALWGGFFALLALVVGVVVLARPAFGTPGPPQAAWIKSVAWGGIALGVLGLLLAVAKYTDILLGLPSAG